MSSSLKRVQVKTDNPQKEHHTCQQIEKQCVQTVQRMLKYETASGEWIHKVLLSIV